MGNRSIGVKIDFAISLRLLYHSKRTKLCVVSKTSHSFVNNIFQKFRLEYLPHFIDSNFEIYLIGGSGYLRRPPIFSYHII